MKKITSLFVAMLLLLSSCGSVPLTGRKQVLLVSDMLVPLDIPHLVLTSVKKSV